MKKITQLSIVILLLIFAFLPFKTVASEASLSPIVVYDVPISSLHPTQAGIGKIQISYKLTEYLANDAALTASFFEDFNEDNGYIKGNYLTADTQTPKQDKNLLKTVNMREELGALVNPALGSLSVQVVIGPHKEYYAIDGHHGSNTNQLIKEMTGLGYDKINVAVIADYSDLDEKTFWQTMLAQKYMYPKAYNVATHQYETISGLKLPKQMNNQLFVNDPFRGLNYFWRSTAINKDTISVPFAEFYWGEFMSRTHEFDDLNFQTPDDYQTAFERGNAIFEKLIAGDAKYTYLFSEVVTQQYGITANQIGLQDSYSAAKLAKQQDKLDTAKAYMFSHPNLTTSNQAVFDGNTPVEPPTSEDSSTDDNTSTSNDETSSTDSADSSSSASESDTSGSATNSSDTATSSTDSADNSFSASESDTSGSDTNSSDTATSSTASDDSSSSESQKNSSEREASSSTDAAISPAEQTHSSDKTATTQIADSTLPHTGDSPIQFWLILLGAACVIIAGIKFYRLKE
ncbi:ParB/Srx family N-terminal domain-containing protein [Brochothrix thermosphacta]|uniref:ParB/Srx family N-terminal domain-containing protein n=1 Tax=Brochothrix thermosphacta TaxID=2756 RepID=UPI0027139779|nr:ParB/Srx family N-terminal domain-containing protein [Brochothrix thermosphacta]MDO7863052.1 ParB/Srx family N-terminal domain-containing protein [Brochothrix thermosphacta]